LQRQQRMIASDNDAITPYTQRAIEAKSNQTLRYRADVAASVVTLPALERSDAFLFD
jgi:hypothetical protein